MNKIVTKHLVLYVLFFLVIPVLLLFYTIIYLCLWYLPSIPASLANTTSVPEHLSVSDGVEAIIATLGMVGVALSYINSARAYRIKGILLDQVITWRWPKYGIIFIIHGLLALLGLFSCKIDALQAAFSCLGGILLCTGYSLYMAYSIYFSRKTREKFLVQYLSELPKYTASPIESRRIAYQLGLYIGERYQAEDFQLDQLSAEAQIDKQLLQSALTLLEPGIEALDQSRQKENKPSYEAMVGSLSDIFDQMLSDKTVFPYGIPENSNDVILLPVTSWGQAFRNHVHHCATLWDNLLYPVERDGKQAKLAADVLLNAPQTAALCCGLVLHLHASRIQSKNGTEGWQSCADFLSRIANCARASNNSAWSNERDKVLRCCMDMILLFICLACLQGANSIKMCTAIDTILIDLFIAEKQKSTSPNCYIPVNAPFFTKYMYFAHMIFRMLAIPGVTVPFRLELYRQIPAITSTLEKFIGKKLSETRNGGNEDGSTAFPFI